MPPTRSWPDSEKHRAEVVSLAKKLLQGNSSWNTPKIILGWIIDTLQQTLELPPHWKVILAKIFADLQTRKRASQKEWRSILGKLRFVSVSIPGLAGHSAECPAAGAQHGHEPQSQDHQAPEVPHPRLCVAYTVLSFVSLFLRCTCGLWNTECRFLQTFGTSLATANPHSPF